MVGQRLLTRSPRMRGGARRVLAVLGGLALLVGLQREGHVTQVGSRYIELEEVVGRSTVIVVAHRAAPRERLEEIPIVPTPAAGTKAPDPRPAAARPNGKSLPPFVRVWARFVVEEVVRGPKQLADKVVEAKSADDGSELQIHRLYYLEGQGESPIYDHYKSSIDWRKGEPTRVILFLTEHAGVYAFAAQGAFEQLARRAEVAKLAAKPSLLTP